MEGEFGVVGSCWQVLDMVLKLSSVANLGLSLVGCLWLEVDVLSLLDIEGSSLLMRDVLVLNWLWLVVLSIESHSGGSSGNESGSEKFHQYEIEFWNCLWDYDLEAITLFICSEAFT